MAYKLGRRVSFYLENEDYLSINNLFTNNSFNLLTNFLKLTNKISIKEIFYILNLIQIEKIIFLLQKLKLIYCY